MNESKHGLRGERELNNSAEIFWCSLIQKRRI